MEKYRRKEVGEEDIPNQLPNEVRITARGKIKTYINVAMSHLCDKHFDRIIIYGKGNSVNKAVTVAEIFKRKVEELNQGYIVDQDTDIYEVLAKDIWDPIEGEKLDRIVVTRHLPCIKITIICTKKTDEL